MSTGDQGGQNHGPVVHPDSLAQEEAHLVRIVDRAEQGIGAVRAAGMDIGALKQQIANVRMAHPGALPLVQLASAPMKTRFGPKPRPDFKVVGWRGGKGDGGTGNATLAPANDMDDDIPF